MLLPLFLRGHVPEQLCLVLFQEQPQYFPSTLTPLWKHNFLISKACSALLTGEHKSHGVPATLFWTAVRAHQVRVLSLRVLITDPINYWNHPVILFLHLGSSPGTRSQWLGLSCCGGTRQYEIQLTVCVSLVTTCNVSTQKKGGSYWVTKQLILQSFS